MSTLPVLYYDYHHEKWYLQSVKEELEWEDYVNAEYLEATEEGAPAGQPQPSA